MPRVKFVVKTNRRLARTSRKNMVVVWLINLIYPGAGNLYVSGNSWFGWGPLASCFLIQQLFHGFGLWLVLYTITAFAASIVVSMQKLRLKQLEAPPGTGSFKAVNSGEERAGSASLNDGQEPDKLAYPTADFERKLREADAALKGAKREPGRDYDTTVKQWLSHSESPHQTYPAAMLDGKTQGLGQPPAQAALGLTHYQPYLPDSSATGGSQLQDPAGDSGAPGTAAGNTAGGIAAESTTPAPTQESSGTAAEACKRCGAKRDHDFSFCLSCGHSYAFS